MDAFDSERRVLRLRLESEYLLRKAPSAPAVRKMRRLRPELASQARTQMQAQGRRAFRGPISVEVDIRAMSLANAASAPPAVKAYLDLLEGIAYADDRQIEHLRVTSG